MPRNLLQKVGQSSVDNLTGDNAFPQLPRIQVLLPPGEYRRGQLLLLDTDIDETMLDEENLVGINASIPGSTATRIDAVLLDDIGETEEDITRASAVIRGQWNLNSVLWGDIPEVSRPAIIRDAWDRGLHLAPQHRAPYVQWGEV